METFANIITYKFNLFIQITNNLLLNLVTQEKNIVFVTIK